MHILQHAICFFTTVHPESFLFVIFIIFKAAGTLPKSNFPVKFYDPNVPSDPFSFCSLHQRWLTGRYWSDATALKPPLSVQV